MGTRLRPMKLGEASDPAVNGIIQFSKDGFGDTQMFGLIARRPELLKRIASVFEYLFGGGGLVEPYLLEMMRIRTGHLNACTY
ncbi:MAG: hypothetical protein HY724_06620 [Candidatus Rokubacteria bacterium]|jgi:hypothetical protein|nr:hypothetical protein [Candidatus Rokubacteria bacterium]